MSEEHGFGNDSGEGRFTCFYVACGDEKVGLGLLCVYIGYIHLVCMSMCKTMGIVLHHLSENQPRTSCMSPSLGSSVEPPARWLASYACDHRSPSGKRPSLSSLPRKNRPKEKEKSRQGSDAGISCTELAMQINARALKGSSSFGLSHSLSYMLKNAAVKNRCGISRSNAKSLFGFRKR